MFLYKQFTDGQAICMKGEDFLYDYKSNIDFIYLDAFDYQHNRHSVSRNMAYKINMNCDITNELCHKMHLECCKNIINKLDNTSVISIDDVFEYSNKDEYNEKKWEGDINKLLGKGVLAIPYLLENNFELKEIHSSTVIIQKVNN